MNETSTPTAYDPKTALDNEFLNWRKLNQFSIDSFALNRSYDAKFIAGLTEIGTRLRQHLGEVTPPTPGPIAIGFVVHNGSMTPETIFTINYLCVDDRPFKPIIFCLSPDAAAIRRDLPKIEVICIHGVTPMKKLLDLRLYAEIYNLSAIMFMGSPLWLATASGLGIKVGWINTYTFPDVAPDFGVPTLSAHMRGNAAIDAFILDLAAPVGLIPSTLGNIAVTAKALDVIGVEGEFREPRPGLDVVDVDGGGDAAAATTPTAEA